MSTDRYDAIVVGGGHNGLVNGAYLAKAGLKTLILERRHLVGGAAITEELRPGFWFTTFSYALSLLRPQIIHELELTKHGFMPLLMATRFAPGEDGEYLFFTRDHDENLREIVRASPPTTPMPTTSTATTSTASARRSSRCSTPVPRTSSATTRRSWSALAALGSRLRALDKRTLHNAVRLLTGSAADFLDDYFESDLLKGWFASSWIIGSKVGPRSQGSGLVLLFHSLGEHDGEFGAWAFHKGGNGGFTQVLARAAQAFGAEIRLEAPVERVLTREGEATGVALADGTEIAADVVVSALDPRRTFLELVEPRELPDDLVEDIRRMKFQGVSSKVNFALDGLPTHPMLGERGGPVPRLPEHRPVDRLPGARVRRREVRLVQRAAVHRLRHPVDDRPGHGAAGQARHVVLRPVHAVPAAREGLGRGARADGRSRPGGAGALLPRLRRPRPSARGVRRRSTSSGPSACRRAISSPASSSRPRCSSSAPRPAGRSTEPRSPATTSAARGPTRGAA